MIYPQEYIDFLVHFHGDRDYFECHEILEEYWKKADNPKKDSVWVGLIQLAVANYHHRRGNFKGALKTLQKALKIIAYNESHIQKLGLNAPALINQITQRMSTLEKGSGYESMNLPIVSKELAEHCRLRSQQLQMLWMSKSDLTKQEIIHRHKERDRTPVIEERKKALQKRNK